MTVLRVNDQEHELEINPQETLAEVLRSKLGLFGVHVSCDAGDCGTCTVLLDGEPVASCLMLAMQAEGKEIITIEGIGTEENLHPIQEAFIEEQGFQCGYCTPGIILSTKALLERNPGPEPTEIAEALNGHICRCGAYPHIIRSVLSASNKMRGITN
jgi:carbon-monoxide dehydrogenase small subunit